MAFSNSNTIDGITLDKFLEVQNSIAANYNNLLPKEEVEEEEELSEPEIQKDDESNLTISALGKQLEKAKREIDYKNHEIEELKKSLADKSENEFLAANFNSITEKFNQLPTHSLIQPTTNQPLPMIVPNPLNSTLKNANITKAPLSGAIYL